MPKIKPNFVIVGFPRCGTTFLYEYLRKHPDICMSKTKELRYFDKDIIEERGGEDYINMNFEHYRGEKIIGEACPNYIFSRDILNEIRKNNCKVLLITRDKKDLANSMKRFIQTTVHENTDNIFEKIKNLETYIKQFKEIFPENKRLILSQEDILKNPYNEYSKILHFLEIKDFKIEKFEKVNDSKKPLVSFLMPLIKKINKREKLKLFLRHIFPLESRRLIYKLNNTYYPANYLYIKKKRYF